MSFISIYYVIFVALLNLVFYCVPVKGRLKILLAGSVFYIVLYSGFASLWLLYAVLTALFFGVAYRRDIHFFRSKLGFVITIAALLFPLLFLKYFCSGMTGLFSELIVPIGISFYTLSLISYVADVWRGKYEPEKKFIDFLLFSLFFSQILQGPIARFDRWKENLGAEHRFDYQSYTFGWQLILWGYFLKFVIADKAGIMVNTVYDNYRELNGLYIVFAALLYSIQLYADFSGCVNIALGTAQTFGFKLQENFRQPYFADSVGDFWRRWHLTLSSWLRDYIYIPLGGNRKGKIRQCLNILIVFGVSGIWHGAGITYILWGLLHGVYQIFEIALDNLSAGVQKGKNSKLKKACKTAMTFLLINFAWMLFRAGSITHFTELVKGMFAVWNPEVILDGDAYFRMGLSRLQTVPLVIGMICLFIVDLLHEKNIRVRETVAKCPIAIRWGIYLAVIMFVLLFGTYGPAYSENQFIYGKF